MPMHLHPTSCGAFKPVGHVLMSFATAAQSDGATVALRAAGFSEFDISRHSPAVMQAQAEAEIGNAGALASIGQELNLVEAHLALALALAGPGFVVVRAPHDDQVQRVADVAASWRATRAQRYGSLIIEELIPSGTSPLQTAESPDPGLDRQTLPRDDVLGPEADA